MTAVAKSAETKRPPSGAGAVLLAAAGLGASFGVAACCALPFLLTGVGIGTAWLGGGIALVAAPHRSLLMAASAICLVGGAILLWRQHTRAVCAPGSICARPAMRGLTLAGLLAGLVLLCLGYIYV